MPPRSPHPAEPSDLAGPATFCRHLGTKRMYVSGRQSVDLRRPSTTAHYFCLHTMRAVGPDDAQAHPDTCRPPRPCCTPDDEA